MIIINVTGNITGDAILKEINGRTLITFTIAHNNTYKKANGETIEEVTFVRCAIWDKPNLSNLFYKGRPIYASGIFKLNEYTDHNGDKQHSVNLRVSFFKVFGKARVNESNKVQGASTLTNEFTDYETHVVEEAMQEEAIKDLPF